MLRRSGERRFLSSNGLAAKDSFVIKCCLCGRIDVQAGAQSSIYAASCPQSEIPKDTIYFHNKYGRWGEKGLSCWSSSF